MSPNERISNQGRENNDLESPEDRQEILSRVQALIEANDPEVIETVKSALRAHESRTAQAGRELYEKNRKSELEKWLSLLDVEGLAIGKVVTFYSRSGESLGIYRGGKHIGDIHSSNFRFELKEFLSAVESLLPECALQPHVFYGVKTSLISSLKCSVGLDVGTWVKMLELGMFIRDGVLITSDEMRFEQRGGENRRVDFSVEGGNVVLTIEEVDGTVIKRTLNGGKWAGAKREVVREGKTRS